MKCYPLTPSPPRYRTVSTDEDSPSRSRLGSARPQRVWLVKRSRTTYDRPTGCQIELRVTDPNHVWGVQFLSQGILTGGLKSTVSVHDPGVQWVWNRLKRCVIFEGTTGELKTMQQSCRVPWLPFARMIMGT